MSVLSTAGFKPSKVSRLRPETVALSKDVALDLGTATTQVVVRGAGLVIEEPTVVAVERRTGDVKDVGRSAIYLSERHADEIDLIWPVRSGAVDDAAMVQRLIARLIRPLATGFMSRMRVLVSVSSCSSPIERRTVKEAAKRSGASSVHLIEHAMAAALGAGLPIHEPVGTLVVDVGAGVTEAALISVGSIVSSSSVRSGSSSVNVAIKQVMRREYGMFITDSTAEDIKLAVSNDPGGADTLIEARGEMAVDGSTMTAILERTEVQSVVDEHLAAAVEAVRSCLFGVSAELSQDLISTGIHLVGGGARLGGLNDRLTGEFGLPVHIADEPERVVALGLAKCLEDQDSLRDLFID